MQAEEGPWGGNNHQVFLGAQEGSSSRTVGCWVSVGAASGTAGAGGWLLHRDSANPVEMNI